MIYLHYRAMTTLVTITQSQRLGLVERRQIRHYRDEQLKHDYPEIRIGQQSTGKPISLYPSDVQFNHSHSQNHYVLVHSQDVQDLGVDIEDYGRVAKMQAFAQRNFHADEYRMWQVLDCCPIFWLKVWTIKEAVLKAHGMGIRLQLSSLNTHAHPTWDFGVVEHLLLGRFAYQCLSLPDAVLTVAYRQQQGCTLQQLMLK